MYGQQSLSEAWVKACINATNKPKITILYTLTKKIRTSDHLQQQYLVDLTDQQKALIEQSIGIFTPCKKEYTKKYRALRHIQPQYRREKRLYKQAVRLQKLIQESDSANIPLVSSIV